MKKDVIIITLNQKQAQQLTVLLAANRFRLTSLTRIEDLSHDIIPGTCKTIILDMDSLSLDNKIIRCLTIQYPQVCFLGISKDTYHPELKEAICYHIYACLNKPLDDDELLYWLKCIEDDETNQI